MQSSNSELCAIGEVEQDLWEGDIAMKIGLAIATLDYERGGKAPSFKAIKAMTQLAESIGFDSVWLFDHLLYRFRSGLTFGIW